MGRKLFEKLRRVHKEEAIVRGIGCVFGLWFFFVVGLGKTDGRHAERKGGTVRTTVRAKDELRCDRGDNVGPGN